MAKYQLSNKALLDLENIWDYTIKKWSDNQAESYFNQIIRTCSELSEHPKIGKSYNKIRKNLFGFKTGKHIIFYEDINEQRIFVLRILHEQMDFENRLKE
jgi:toxin ParE1/3/4